MFGRRYSKGEHSNFKSDRPLEADALAGSKINAQKESAIES
jgi:hypothetical protein